VPTIFETLRTVAASGLLAIPESLAPLARPDDVESAATLGEEDEEDAKAEVIAWRHAPKKGPSCYGRPLIFLVELEGIEPTSY